MNEERAYWLAWSQISGVGAVLLQRIQAHFGSLSAAWTAPPHELAAVEGIGLLTASSISAERLKLNPAHLLETHQKRNPDFVTPADADYPKLLLEIPDAPPILYYRGQSRVLKTLKQHCMIALVGTRHPSDYGRRWTRKLSATLAQNGFSVISGLADGIDAEAHQSCIEVGGTTIAVLGTGVDVVYPWKNRKLYDQVLETGLAISEYPAGTQPDRIHFPRRNRIVAGLSRAVLVIEAPLRSGALITANLANDYGRDVYALPGSLDNEKSEGCLALISKGAQIVLSEAELLKLLGTLPVLDRPQTTQLPLLDLSPELAQVLQTIQEVGARSSHPAIPLDLIIQQSELPTSTVTGSLLQLEMLGLVVQVPGMRYQIS